MYLLRVDSLMKIVLVECNRLLSRKLLKQRFLPCFRHIYVESSTYMYLCSPISRFEFGERVTKARRVSRMKICGMLKNKSIECWRMGWCSTGKEQNSGKQGVRNSWISLTLPILSNVNNPFSTIFWYQWVP